MRAPAARAPARQGASSPAGAAEAATTRLPAVVGTPATSIRSFTASRGPEPGPGSRAVMKVAMSEDNANFPPRRWVQPPPGRLVGRGHPAGDFLEAWKWDLREEGPGYLLIEADLPAHVRNPRGQLFGGF